MLLAWTRSNAAHQGQASHAGGHTAPHTTMQEARVRQTQPGPNGNHEYQTVKSKTTDCRKFTIERNATARPIEQIRLNRVNTS